MRDCYQQSLIDEIDMMRERSHQYLIESEYSEAERCAWQAEGVATAIENLRRYTKHTDDLQLAIFGPPE